MKSAHAKILESKIIFEGKELNQVSIKDSERVGIAIIHQELALIKQLSIAENIFIGNEIGEHGLVNFSEQLNKIFHCHYLSYTIYKMFSRHIIYIQFTLQ